MASYVRMQNDSYKTIHEAFVTNNTGTTPWELVAVISPWMMTTFLLQLMYSWQYFRVKSKVFGFSVEFIGVIIQLLVLTTGADHSISYATALLMVCIGVVILMMMLSLFEGVKLRPGGVWDVVVAPTESKQFTFITNFRGQLSILVYLSILAVDFPIFPRRFAKTETFGYGLMDTGVGFFMIANGITAPEAKMKYDFAKNKDAFRKSLISSIPLIVIGSVRTIAVKLINYQEHLTEYGVHWNFFFSLAMAKILTSSIFLYVPPVASGLIAAVLAVFYQVILQLGLKDIILYGIDGQDSRSNILDANREGLVSCIGFTCLYLAGIQLGYLLFRSGNTLKSLMKTVAMLGAVIKILTPITSLCHYYIEPASRRLVNITYMLWLTAFMYGIIWVWIILNVVEVLLKYFASNRSDKHYIAKPTIINQSLSYNFLLAFILANILTGCVNMSMETIYASDLKSVLVLVSYAFVLCSSMSYCYFKNWQLKFW